MKINITRKGWMNLARSAGRKMAKDHGTAQFIGWWFVALRLRAAQVRAINF